MRLALAALALFAAAPALAQQDQPAPAAPPIKFIDMEAYQIQGARVVPVGLQVDARERARFAQLFDLKQRSIVAKLRATAKDPGLR
ncbi:MAG: hypothetical protein H6706_00800 [Myxococcales bacterium]|nr:hypothetical protein [Myxococcales bacterium]